MSPEQTGRINSIIDHRSDLYSFGITLYEIFAGYLPFGADDLPGWILCHLAKQPLPLPSHLPPILCKIILKLINKRREDRYSSAKGLAFDLDICLHRLQSQFAPPSSSPSPSPSPTTLPLNNNINNNINNKNNNNINNNINNDNNEKGWTIESFQLGEGEEITHFHITNKLYGREEQLKIVDQLLDEVSSSSSSSSSSLSSSERGVCYNRVLFVKGEGGIGKTSFCSEIERKTTLLGGSFIFGLGGFFPFSLYLFI